MKYKLNNKGMTLVELIITFAVLTGMVVAMLTIVLEVRNQASDNAFKSEMYDYRNLLIKTIEDDVLRNSKVVATDCELTTCTFTLNNGESRTIAVDRATFTITYNGVAYPVPNSDILDLGGYSFREQPLTDTVNALIIKISYTEKTEPDTDYGFKIVAIME